MLRAASSDHVWAKILPGDFKQLGYLALNCYAADFDALVEQVIAGGARRADAHPQATHQDGAWFQDPEGNLLQLRVGPKTTTDARDPERPPPRANADRGVIDRTARQRVEPTRLSHILLFARDVEAQVRFYESTFGLGLSDKSEGIIAFMHGRHGSDHHLLAFAKSHGRGWHHASWDVPGFEDVGLGWMQMQEAGYDRVWGPGRHVLGSNYFCYVQDPWGSFCEYSAHIDYVPAGHVWPGGNYPPEDSLYLWGPVPLPNFITNTEIHPDQSRAGDDALPAIAEVSPVSNEKGL
ncbi:VOC family protein [Pseudoxanthomonas sp. JBR18]|uniref:VOC family protein n=1 Tax=Pseudoxanthomonas sp. JBR18 TaxID=2969308 RepID=UPI002FDF63DF